MYLQKVRNKQKNLIFFVGILKVTDEKSQIQNPRYISQKYGSEDPDPYQNVTDLEHW